MLQPTMQEHFQAKLSGSELITLGLPPALKGVSQRAFYRWIKQNRKDLFPRLLGRTRLFRQLKTHRKLTEKFLVESTLFGVIDSCGIELCHPIKENHQPRRKRSGKFCLLANKFGLAADWSVKTANLSDSVSI